MHRVLITIVATLGIAVISISVAPSVFAQPSGQAGQARGGEQVQLLSGLPIVGDTTPGIVPFLNVLFTMLLSGAAILAVIFIAIGGFEMMSRDSPFHITEGKDRIRNAVIGLLIILGSYLILYTINPDLVSLNIFRTLSSQPIETGGIFPVDQREPATDAQRAVHGKAICLDFWCPADRTTTSDQCTSAGCALDGSFAPVCYCHAVHAEQDNSPVLDPGEAIPPPPAPAPAPR